MAATAPPTVSPAGADRAGTEPIGAPPRSEFHLETQRIESLAAKLENAADPETRAAALELVQSVVELHGAALDRMIQSFCRTAEGEKALRETLHDDMVAGIFLLHGLHPDDIQTRVMRGIEKVRPYLQSHGGDVELESVRDGIVRLVLHGSCGSCPSSSLTLKSAVEDALFEVAPDIVEIVATNAAAGQHANSNLVVLK